MIHKVHVLVAFFVWDEEEHAPPYIYVYSTREKAEAGIALFCRDMWKDRFDEPIPEIPIKDADVVERYYADWDYDINEGYYILDEIEIDEPVLPDTEAGKLVAPPTLV